MDIGGNAWDLELVQARVQKFCELVKEMDIEIKVFIDV